MEAIISRDRTPIAYHRTGAGPPLILVHGSGGSNPAVGWPEVVSALGARYTVLAMDRRGYGHSGDAPTYAVEREFEDIAALVDATGAPAALLGHSFGALCALGAALLAHNVSRLILYEPAITFPGKPFYDDDVLERMQALLDAGDREGVLALAYGEIAGMSPRELEVLRSAATWPARLGRAHLMVRESWAEQRYVFDEQACRRLAVPALLLSGGDSPAPIQAVTRALHACLANSRIAVLPGQGHLAMVTQPELFLQTVLAFLEEDTT